MTRRRQRGGGSWIRTRTRWAIYLRDGLRCLYCFRTITELIEARTFLTLDHIDPKRGNEPRNLVSCCHGCNTEKARMNVSDFSRLIGIQRSTILSRIMRSRRRDLTTFRAQAQVLLGELDGIKRADIILDHDWMVKAHFSDRPDIQAELDHIDLQRSMHCPECERLWKSDPKPGGEEHDDIPF